MTYLTKFPINGARRQAKFLLGSPQAMHAAVMASFPPAQSKERVLWRVDQDGRHRKTLYIVSPAVPELEHLVEQAGWAAEPGRTASYDGLLKRLASGEELVFRLRANPVHQVKGDDGVSRKLAHVTVRQQLDWLVRRSDRLGIVLTDDAGVPRVVVSQRERRTFRRQGRDVTIATAQFDGLLTIKDPEAVRGALVSGIGRAKAYGCGLMTLARPTHA